VGCVRDFARAGIRSGRGRLQSDAEQRRVVDPEHQRQATAVGDEHGVALLATTARADLPDKNKDREGWIKGSMTGKQAGFCGPTAPKDLTGGADPDFVRDQVAKQWDGVARLWKRATSSLRRSDMTPRRWRQQDDVRERGRGVAI
jgi:hypothetical protein